MVEAVASPGVEIFGIHELVLNANNKSGYKDVYPVSRKKRPWQAKVWDTARQSHVSLGSFGTPRDAAVAVMLQRLARPASRTFRVRTRAVPHGAREVRLRIRAATPHAFCCSFLIRLSLALRREAEARGDTRHRPFGAFVLQLVILDPAAAHGDAAAARSG